MKFGDIATYYNGYAFKPAQYSHEGRQIIRIQDLTGNAYETHRFDGELPEKYHVKKGDVLISWSASLGIFVWRDEDAYLNQHIFKVVFNKADVSIPFFVHQARYVIGNAKHLAHGSTMTHLTKKVFDSLPFNLPPMEAQIRESANLSFIEEQITKAKEQLNMFDELVKSRFVEMFGDPVDEQSRWPRKPIKDFCELRIGPFGSTLHKQDYIVGGHPLVNPSHIVDGSIAPADNLTISDEKYNEMEAYHLALGDVVLGRRGEIGRCAVVCDEGYLCGTGSMIVRPGQECRPDYLQRVLSFPSFKDALERNAVGQTMKNLNAKIVGNAVVALPSMQAQQEFAAFVQQVDKLKFETQQAIDKLQMLYDSLAQEYFGSE